MTTPTTMTTIQQPQNHTPPSRSSKAPRFTTPFPPPPPAFAPPLPPLPPPGWPPTTLCHKSNASSSKRSQLVRPMLAQPIRIRACLQSSSGAHSVVGTIGISSEEMPVHQGQHLQLSLRPAPEKPSANDSAQLWRQHLSTTPHLNPTATAAKPLLKALSACAWVLACAPPSTKIENLSWQAVAQ